MINGKVYIGQTINTLEYRQNQHIREAKLKNRPTVYFHNAINKYGEENFRFEIIDTACTQKELDEKEIYWISYYQSNNKEKGYNLDSGGKSGGVKSEETKRKIGQTTKEKWKNEEIAKRMMEGLRKGTETVKKNKKLFQFQCPVCGKILYESYYQVKNRKHCSLKCAAASGSCKKGLEQSIINIRERNIETKTVIKKFIIDWAMDHKDTVMNCPYNKITTTLQELLDLIYEEYNIKDFRSIYLCLEATSRKDFLKKLKEIIYISEENIC